ncbi:MAG: hypothetical protein V1809_02520 [Planctomycetota bacterium]
MNKIFCYGWNNCLGVSNGTIELVVTLDVGPRIIRFGFAGGTNLFRVYPEMMGKTGGREWRIYGGHRLWVAPELPSLTYFPDNRPVAARGLPGGVRIVAPPERPSGIAKTMDIRLHSRRAAVTVTHRIRNAGRRTLTIAPWGLSVLREDTRVVFPLPTRARAGRRTPLPTGVFGLWDYTDFLDDRWMFGRRFVILRQVRGRRTSQKIGSFVPDGWAAAAGRDFLLVKRFPVSAGRAYPDGGCNFETYTDGNMIEIETLGPLVNLAPGQSVAHAERWFLFPGVPALRSDRDVEKYVMPRVRETGGRSLGV